MKIITVPLDKQRESQELKDDVGKWFDLTSLVGRTKSDMVFKSEISEENSPWLILQTEAKIIDAETGDVLVILKKKNRLREKDFTSKFFGDSAEKFKSKSRGSAAGLFDIDLARKVYPGFKVGKQIKFSAFGLLPDGRISNSHVSNPSNSIIIGYTDTKLRAKGEENNLCRLTATTIKHPDEVLRSFPFFEDIDAIYQQVAPMHHAAQMKAISSIIEKSNIDVSLGKTAFSTVTVNKNFRTGLHVDKGDFKDSLGVLTMSCSKNHIGGEIVFPEYNLAVRMEDGDILLFNPHLHHSTCPYNENATRITFVAYLREKLLQTCKYSK